MKIDISCSPKQFQRKILRCLGVPTYPQPKIMNTPGRSLSRSSLFVRARHRGIKPGEQNKTFVVHAEHNSLFSQVELMETEVLLTNLHLVSRVSAEFCSG